MNDKQLAALTPEQARRLIPPYVLNEIVRVDMEQGPAFFLSERAGQWLMEGDNCVILDKAGWTGAPPPAAARAGQEGEGAP